MKSPIRILTLVVSCCLFGTLLSCTPEEDRPTPIPTHHNYLYLLAPEEILNELYIEARTTGKPEYPDDPWIVPYGIATEFAVNFDHRDGAFFFSNSQRGQFDHFYEKIAGECNASISAYQLETQCYFYATVREGITVYADQPLFGRAAGENLVDLVDAYVHSDCMLRLTYPDFHVEGIFEEKQLSLTDYLKPGYALPRCLHATFREVPAETYERLTFTIEIPFECEYLRKVVFGLDYSDGMYEHYPIERNENRVLHASITFKYVQPEYH